MYYSTEEIRGISPLRTLPRLMANETVNYIDFVPVRTSRRLNKNIISLEDATIYMTHNALNFNEFIHEISNMNMIDESSIIFSVQPSSVYLNEDIRDMMSFLVENSIPVYQEYNPNTREYKIINETIDECIRIQSLQPLYVLQEFLGGWGDPNAYADGAANGGLQGAMSVGADLLQGLFGNTVNQFRNTTVDSIRKKIDEKIGGFFGDEKKDQFYLNPDTGKTESRKVTVHNANLEKKLADSKFLNMDFFKKNPNIKKNIVGAVSSLAGNAREGFTDTIINKAQEMLGIDPDKDVSVPNLINAITQKISRIRSQPNSGFLNSLINKLVAMKNHLISIFNGRK